MVIVRVSSLAQVLEEREKELTAHDAWFDKCKTVLADRDHEISELKLKLADVQVIGDQHATRIAETERGYQV